VIPALVLCVVAAVLAPTLVRRWGTRGILALALVPATLFAGALAQFPWSPGQVRVAGFPWVPSLGVEASFLLDGLSYVFTLLITGIGTLIVIYAAGYTGGKAGSGRLLGWLLFFTAAMLGLVWSDNLITLFVFWELTSVASFMLIGWKHEDAASRTSARRALAVTGAGGLVLLAGLILLALIGRDAGLGPVEALTLSRLLVLDAIPQHALYPFALACILVGAFTKSAQVPAHFWLPGAMTAPTPVSAFLHSATMVKAGIYLLANPADDAGVLHRYSDTAERLIELLVQLNQTRLAIVVISGANAMVEHLARCGADREAALAVCRRLTLQGMGQIERGSGFRPVSAAGRPPAARAAAVH